ncbi:hypothetical protein JCM8547_000236 [Rhodosporidiobolus lusitaniae]
MSASSSLQAVSTPPPAPAPNLPSDLPEVDVHKLYRPFLATKNAPDEPDWIDALELDTVKTMAVQFGRPLRILVLYGSLRERSFSRLTAFESSRILHRLGCDVRVFDPAGLPMKDGVSGKHEKVVELRRLSEWSDGQVWVSPEQHGTVTAVFKNQIDWIPLSVGSVRPTQGRTLAVIQVCGGSQSFNVVNLLRVLGRWMRMITIPNQSSIPKAWTHFSPSDRLLPSSNRDRLVDVMEELVKLTCLLAPHIDLLGDRYSEREEKREHGRLRTQEEQERGKREREEEVKRPAEAGRRTHKEVVGETLKMSGRRLYIGRVPQQASNRDFQEYFGSLGKLVEVRIMAGFAFIEYDQLRDAEQAVAEYNNKDFLGERILVEFAKPPRAMDDRFGPPRGGYGGGGYGGPPPPRGYGGGYGYDMPPRNPPARPGSGYRLVVSGLAQGTSWQELKDFGRTIGNVSFADVDRSDPNIGFIEFSSRRDADDAISSLSGKDLNGSTVTLSEDRNAPAPRGGYDSRPSDRGYDRRDRYDDRRDDRDRDRRDDRRSDDRDRRDDRRDDRDRRRSPTPERRRSRSPARRRSPSPAGGKERERSPARERSRSRSPRYRD